MGAVIAVLLVVGVIWFVVQTTQAHGKQLDPSTFHPSFAVERRLRPVPADPNAVVSAAATQVSGMSVAAVVGNAVYLNCRPNVTRLDDGMGMFLRITSSAESGEWVMRIEGEAKSRLAMSSDQRRGFLSMERHIRQAIAQFGHQVDDGLGVAAPTTMPVAATAPVAMPPAPPTLPPPTRSIRAHFEHGGRAWNVDGVVVVGRDPSSGVGDLVGGVRIDDRLLSKQHVSIRKDDRTVWVQDRGSTNGTVIRSRTGDRIANRGVDEHVVDGDVVLIGDQQLVVRIMEV